MIYRKIIRNKITGILFGKYNLETISAESFIPGEEYISGIEILYYDEVLILLATILSIFTAVMIFTNPILVLLFGVVIILIFFSIELELSVITSERVIIEKRGITEKLLKISNKRNISIDQIAVLSYARAPFNYSSLGLGVVMLLFSFLILFFDNVSLMYFPNNLLISFFGLVVLVTGLYLIWYGLRLTKRSINLEIIGLKRIISIGNVKGAPEWFLKDLEMMIYDRIHHTHHNKLITDHSILEHPLDYSSILKDLISHTYKTVQINILKTLSDGNLPKKELLEKLPEYTKPEIDIAMRLLRKKQLVHYHRHSNCWCINDSHDHVNSDQN